MAEPAEYEEIWRTIRQVFESFSNRDEASLESNFDPDCTAWDVFEPDLICGAEERAAFHVRDRSQSEARGPLTWSLEPVKLDIIGDVAIARYLLHFVYQPPHPFKGTIRITDILQRTSPLWKIIHHHEGLIPSGPPGSG